MKNRASWLLIPTVALGLGACEKKEQVTAPDVPGTAELAEGGLLVPAPILEVTALSADERAAKLGFVKHLPADTEVVMSFYNGTKTAERVKATKLWKLIEKQMAGGVGMGMGMPMDEEFEMEEMDVPEVEQDDALGADVSMDDEEVVGPAMLFGSEFSIAFGETTGEQTANLLTFNRRSTYFQMRALAKAMVAAAKGGDTESLEDSLMSGYSSEMFAELLKDPDSGIQLLERSNMPPIYFAFRVSESQRAEAAQQLAAMVANVGMFGDVVEPAEIDVNGGKFSGFKISGEKVSASLAENRESMEESLDAATVDQLLAVLAKKDIVIASGIVGDHVLLFLGSSLEELKLAENPADSLVGSAALAFSDAYVSKDLAALIYVEKDAMDMIYASAGGLADITNGLRDGIAGSDGLGETRDLETMFQIVAEREASLRRLVSSETQGMVAFFEDGLKIESYGGTDNGAFDWETPSKLSHLGDSADVAMFANMTVDAGYDQRARDYMEALLETAYAITMKVSELPLENSEIAQFKEMATLFDSKFRNDAVALWDAFVTDFGDSLGGESAWVVDLKGGAPAIPGIPQEVVDKAQVPRISMISPVTDRATLSGSWDKMNTTATSILGKVSEMTGTDIPMQKPISSEKNDLTTWFFPMPFITDDFLPSVTVGDKWFVASTSKNHALDLVAKADAPTSAEVRTGLRVTVNFKALETYAVETAKLVDENAEAMMGAPLTPEQKELTREAIEVLSDFDTLTIHGRREAGVLRSSIHFKTR